VNESTMDMLRAAEEAVRRLIEECRKNGSFYARSPKTVAHISRTGKWHLNAIASLRQVLDGSDSESTNNGTRRGA
jgi:hypothetical protein